MKMKYTPEMLAEAVANSYSMSEVLRYLRPGMSVSGTMGGHLKERIRKLGFDTSHFVIYRRVTGPRNYKWLTTDEILVRLPDESTVRTRRERLLRAMLEKGVIYRCAEIDCPSPEPIWRGKTLTLDVEHIDGDWKNNTIENLAFLCPNCHHQTITSCHNKAVTPDMLKVARPREKDSCPDCDGLKTPSAPRCMDCKFKKSMQRGIDDPDTLTQESIYKIDWPDFPILRGRVVASNFSKVSRELGVSPSAVRKRFAKFGYDPKTLQPYIE